jgi:phosphoglucomutase
MALWYHLKGIPLDVAYENLEKKYGYHATITDNVYFEGSEGQSEMKAIMAKLHANPPKVVAGNKVVEVQDYEKGTIVDSEGHSRPTGLEQSEVVKLIFEDSSWIAIRPSGTEPKCKFYIEAYAKSGEGLEDRAKAMCAELKKDLGVKA